MSKAAIVRARAHWTHAAAILIGGITLLAGAVGAEAQYYHQPTPRYYPAPHYQPQPWPPFHDYGYEEVYRPVPRARHYSHSPGLYSGAQASAGSVCVTSRGECSVGGYYPIGTGCKCNIPGFGRKRGHVQY